MFDPAVFAARRDAYMQAIGRTAMPWYINSEKQTQEGRPYLALQTGAGVAPSGVTR